MKGLPAVTDDSGALMRIEPAQLRQDDNVTAAPLESIVIRHGGTTIELSSNVPVDSIAALVAAMNRHA